VTDTDTRKVIFGPGRVRVGGSRVRGITPAPPPPVHAPSGGHGIGQGSGGGRGHGKGGGNGLAALALALGAVSATGGKVVPSPPDVPGAMTLICSQVLSAPQTTFDTNTILGGTIPATYNHLLVYFQGRSDKATTDYVGVTLALNAVSTGGQYDREDFEITGTNAVVVRTAAGENVPFLGMIPAANGVAGACGSVDALIQQYQSPFFKIIRSRNSYELNHALNKQPMGEGMNIWYGTTAVTRLTLAMDTTGNFVVGSSFYLYGVT
jgi:hypothetical protein